MKKLIFAAPQHSIDGVSNYYYYYSPARRLGCCEEKSSVVTPEGRWRDRSGCWGFLNDQKRTNPEVWLVVVVVLVLAAVVVVVLTLLLLLVGERAAPVFGGREE